MPLFGHAMKIRNKGLLAAAWFVLSVAYMTSVVVHIVEVGFSGGHFSVPMCLDNHILEDLPIPLAGVIASLFLCKHSIWPRIVLGLAAGGLIFVIWMMVSTTAHHKPYLLYGVVFIGCIWTLVTVSRQSEKTEQMHAEATSEPAPSAASEASDA
jgi:hypothetical protein